MDKKEETAMVAVNLLPEIVGPLRLLITVRTKTRTITRTTAAADAPTTGAVGNARGA
jgi:hypothetical protein